MYHIYLKKKTFIAVIAPNTDVHIYVFFGNVKNHFA